jgi:hypothetical protein
MAYTKYSLTPADNNAAPPNGAPEGMLPSAVNDTMRDMMAQIRDVGDGIRGGTYTMTAPVITGGSITGVALSGNTLTNPVITGGSINNTTVGATTRSTGAFTTLASNGATTFTAGTASTSTTTGTAVITGGLGVSGRINAANFDGIVGANTAAAGNFTTLGATGVATFSAGTVSAPAITTTGDTNTGIFFPAADTIAFTEGGVESMRIDSSGNVGIGTSSPSYKLDVNGTARVVQQADFNNAINLNTSTLNYVYFTDAVAFARNGVGERMRIDSSGNVGIGTSSPSNALNIYRSTAAGLQIDSDASAFVRAANYSSDTNSSGLQMAKYRGTLASPSAVNSGDGAGRLNYLAYGGTNIRSIASIDGFVDTYTSDTNISGSLRFLTNGGSTSTTERMRIDSSGRLGLGVTPSAWGSNYSVEDVGSFGAIASLNTLNQFHVTCNSYNDNTNWKFKTVNASLRYTLQNDQHEWYYSASGSAGSNITYTQVMVLTAAGNLTISGATATKASGTTWANPSDVRLKENITNFTKGLNELLQVNVKKWEYNGKGDTVAGTKGLGVIADEIMQVLPETVDTYKAKLNSDDKEKTDIKRFDATEITWLLVNAVKEQQTLINQLTTRLNALEGK